MSDFAGIWRLDGRPVAAELLQRLGLALEAREIGPPRIWQQDSLAIVHRQHFFTPEDERETLPLSDASGAVLAADVFLVGRQELVRELGPTVSHAHPDGALLLAALQRWDVAALPRLYGSFALAFYQPTQRRLLLARDPVGQRSLFVHRSPGFIAFSTRLRALLAIPEIPRTLDERALAHRLIMSRTCPQRTLYQAIDRVPMGHALVLTPETMHSQSWWTPPAAGSLQFGSDAEVEAAAAEVLDRAVADALRARGPVAACLTGGLDTGSIVLSAARQQAPASLLTLTRIPSAATATDSQTHYYDESPRASRLAASHAGIDWHTVGDDTEDWGERDPERWWREGGQPMRSMLNMAWFFPLYRFLHARGGRVMVGGELGNAFFSFNGLVRLPQLLRQGRWLSLARETQALARADGLSLRKAVQRHLLRPFAPPALLGLWHGLPAEAWQAHSALRPELAQELGLHRDLYGSFYRFSVGGRHCSLKAIREWFLGNVSPMDNWGVLRALSGVDNRMPYGDRRVIEFFGSLPLDQFLRQGVSRSLPRRLLAARGAPADVFASPALGVQHSDWLAHLSARRDELHAQLEIARNSALARRVIDLPRLQRLLDQWPQDASSAEPQSQQYLNMLPDALQMGVFLARHERGV